MAIASAGGNERDISCIGLGIGLDLSGALGDGWGYSCGDRYITCHVSWVVILLISIRIKVLIFHVIYLVVFVLWYDKHQEDFLLFC